MKTSIFYKLNNFINCKDDELLLIYDVSGINQNQLISLKNIFKSNDGLSLYVSSKILKKMLTLNLVKNNVKGACFCVKISILNLKKQPEMLSKLKLLFCLFQNKQIHIVDIKKLITTQPALILPISKTLPALTFKLKKNILFIYLLLKNHLNNLKLDV